ncbi:MAG TPA: vitamin K epoxide reductase family protein [Thermodesulfobacteriota bacterium]|nr:vitamin K epoxide reductase family protein [Thermodesulfobacteriota bacterium]
MRTKENDTSRIILLVLSALGFAVSLYLTYLYYSKTEAAFCAAGSGCDAVRDSSYSAILGVPVSLLGVIGYSLIFVLSLISMEKGRKWLLLYVISLGGFVFSAYLTYVEFFIIKAACFYCVVSALLITAVFVILLFKKPVLTPGFSTAKLVSLTLVILAAVLFGSYFIQSKELSAESASAFQVELAKHLGGIGAAMYGSYQCPHCTTQKLMFGKKAFEYINYVECHPRGEHANTALCYAKGIHNYPTWEINGQFYVGARSLQELARLSGFKWDGKTK